jgi:hypothetical protein
MKRQVVRNHVVYLFVKVNICLFYRDKSPYDLPIQVQRGGGS